MKPAKRLVQWGAPEKRSGQTVRRSTCNRYELLGAAGKSALFTVVENPDARGTYEYRVRFVERSEGAALDKLDALEAKRLAAMEKAA